MKDLRPISPIADAKIAEAYKTGDPEKVKRAFEERFGMKPGTLDKNEKLNKSLEASLGKKPA